MGVYLIGVHFTRCASHRRVLYGGTSYCVYLIGVYLTGIHLISVYLLGVHLMGVVCLEAFRFFSVGVLGKVPYTHRKQLKQTSRNGA